MSKAQSLLEELNLQLEELDQPPNVSEDVLSRR
jgi:hypothetical protein